MTSSVTGRSSVSGRVATFLVVALGTTMLLASAAAVSAQDQPCDGVGDYPCGYQLNDVRVQQGPAVFNFQARLSQTKLPAGATATFPVVVKLVSEGTVLCTETVDNVKVKGGILNVSIGRNISCELEEVLAENHNLYLQLCIGGPSSCLKPIALAVQPYAMKSIYAREAMVADYANIAAQASYAHRATADSEMFLRTELGAGYFDFYSHTAPAASDLYTEDQFKPYVDSGFIQWTPARSSFKTLHVTGRNADSGQLALLDELVLAGDRSRITGDLNIQSNLGGNGGLVVEGEGETVHIFGDSTIMGTLLVSGKTDSQELLTVNGNLLSNASLYFGDQVTVAAGGLDLAGGLHVTGGLSLEQGLDSTGVVTVTGNANFADPLQTQNLNVQQTLGVLGNADIAEMTADSANFSGTLEAASMTLLEGMEVQGTASVAGAMEIGGEVLIKGVVLLNGGAINAGGDMRYVQAGGEVRPLTWGGDISFDGGLGMGADLNLALHRAHEFSMQLSAGPPMACTEDVDGLFYLDTNEAAMMLCSAGKYRKLGAPECGNGYVEPGEECDDNNSDNGDGCNSACEKEEGFICLGASVQPTVCVTICNDGLIRGDEVCDDGPGGVGDGDGCAADCTETEAGWNCGGEPTVCESICHDGMVRGNEDCDQGPGLEADGDGCSASCTAEAGFTCTDEPSDCQPWVCGDGAIDGPEECDDGNTQDGDGCSGTTCQIEDGFECVGLPSVCTSCGNGSLYGTEQCDDGNKNNGDGCSSICMIEPGYQCSGMPSNCVTVCGDGLRKGAEQCDDGNKNNNDGCSSVCVPESGWNCSGYAPTKCYAICGDGVKKPTEGCDDKNTNNGDGCSSSCSVEAKWKCSGSPSKCYKYCSYGTFWSSNSHCYYYVSSTMSHWSARQYCKGLGMYLATPTSGSENSKIRDTAGARGWIGVVYDNGWKYVVESTENGSGLSYSYWASNEPSGDGTCVEMFKNEHWVSPGQWNDINCNESKPFVCERVW